MYFMWLVLNSSQDHFGLHQGKNVSDHGVRGPPKTIFDAYNHLQAWSNMFCGGRGKRGALVGEKKTRGPWQRNVVVMNFNEIVFGEEKMKTRQ